MRNRRTRVALAGLITVLLGITATGVARADTDANLSDVKVAPDGTVTGVLTVRPQNNQDVALEPDSLVLKVDGKESNATALPVAGVERSTILLIDRSGSMQESGMATVRNSVKQFLQTVPADVKVGVVSFGDQARLDLEPTVDHAAVQNAVAGLRSGGDTALYDGLSTAINTLGASGDRSILVLSDGKDTISSLTQKPAEEKLTASGVRAQVIAFKTNTTDQLALELLARAGQGSVTPVEDGAGVARAFTSAAKALDGQVSWSAKIDGVHGQKDLTLRGKANGSAFTATAVADFGTAPVAPTPTPSASRPAGPPVVAAPAPDTSLMGTLSTRKAFGVPLPVGMSAVLLFAALMLLATALMSPAFKSKRRARVESIDQYVTQVSYRAAETVRTTSVSGLAEQLVHLGDRVVEGRESTPKTALLLQRADLPWRVGEWAVLRVIAMLVGMLLGILLCHGDLLLALLGGLLGIGVGLLAPPAMLRFLAGRRARKFERQLPDVLALVASSLSTGFSLPQALDAVARDVGQPAAKEFSRAMAETRIGSNTEEALERLAVRMDSKNMHWTAMAIQIQRRVGGNLAETLRTTATTLREREALFRQVRALSAEGRLSAVILVALPIVIFVWMLYINNEYVSLLWRSLIGLVMSFAAVVLLVIGIFWMRKVVEVEV